MCASQKIGYDQEPLVHRGIILVLPTPNAPLYRATDTLADTGVGTARPRQTGFARMSSASEAPAVPHRSCVPRQPAKAYRVDATLMW